MHFSVKKGYSYCSCGKHLFFELSLTGNRVDHCRRDIFLRFWVFKWNIAYATIEKLYPQNHRLSNSRVLALLPYIVKYSNTHNSRLLFFNFLVIVSKLDGMSWLWAYPFSKHEVIFISSSLTDDTFQVKWLNHMNKKYEIWS